MVPHFDVVHDGGYLSLFLITQRWNEKKKLKLTVHGRVPRAQVIQPEPPPAPYPDEGRACRDGEDEANRRQD